MPYSYGFLHHLLHNFDVEIKVEALTRAHVQLQRDGIQILQSMV